MEKSREDTGIVMGFLAYFLIFIFFTAVAVLGRPILSFDRTTTVAYGIAIGIPLVALFAALRRRSARADQS